MNGGTADLQTGANPDTELVVIEGAGHVPLLTFPQRVAGAINRRIGVSGGGGL